MKNKKVSIIIPVYNTGVLAFKLVEKLLNDKYRNLEILLVDDGSTDDSLNALKEIKDSRVRIFTKKNGGPSSARNLGIKNITGEYLLFLDSDDNVSENFISEMVGNMDDDTAMAVCSVRYRKLWLKSEEDVYLDDFKCQKNESKKNFILRSLTHDGRMYPAFNKIFRSDAVRDNNLLFDEKMKFGEDTKFVLNYLNYCSGKIRFILKPLYIYNAGTPTSTAKKMEREWKNWRKCFSNLKKWVGKNPSFNEKRLLALIYLKWRASWLKARF